MALFVRFCPKICVPFVKSWFDCFCDLQPNYHLYLQVTYQMMFWSFRMRKGIKNFGQHFEQPTSIYGCLIEQTPAWQRLSLEYLLCEYVVACTKRTCLALRGFESRKILAQIDAQIWTQRIISRTNSLTFCIYILYEAGGIFGFTFTTALFFKC